ncbi:hypothetical protein D187_009490 [Cystobacter fuscus DSM 2262]|uniref:Uncharacterized protein n=1 Tax=Cystobacter fuscus (strain ATCC 25194 / DSM 2262 / NBRC 100088 / M29) TaxID=1242864 RepID=S9NWK0_CYSF2|nr:hypothetical protein D187_009490 [Cystobacter fuscus DSM 2262]
MSLRSLALTDTLVRLDGGGVHLEALGLDSMRMSSAPSGQSATL